jgi:hypothetical protein
MPPVWPMRPTTSRRKRGPPGKPPSAGIPAGPTRSPSSGSPRFGRSEPRPRRQRRRRRRGAAVPRSTTRSHSGDLHRMTDTAPTRRARFTLKRAQRYGGKQPFRASSCLPCSRCVEFPCQGRGGSARCRANDPNNEGEGASGPLPVRRSTDRWGGTARGGPRRCRAAPASRGASCLPPRVRRDQRALSRARVVSSPSVTTAVRVVRIPRRLTEFPHLHVPGSSPSRTPGDVIVATSVCHRFCPVAWRGRLVA